MDSLHKELLHKELLHKELLHKELLHKELLHKELLQTELFQKKLVLNGLNVPSEIISIIKDYTFMDITMSTQKKRKHMVHRLIGNTKWCGKKRPQDEEKGIMLFWIENVFRSPQFQLRFCKKCGDFISHTNLPFEEDFDKVACHC
jgi:hypothetical protein